MSYRALSVNTLRSPMAAMTLLRRALAPAVLALAATAAPASAGLILPEAGPSENAQDTQTLYLIVLFGNFGGSDFIYFQF